MPKRIATSLFVVVLLALTALGVMLFVSSEDNVMQKALSDNSNRESGAVVLRLGHEISSQGAIHLGALHFAEQVAEKTAGRIRVDVYPEQQLGTPYEMIDQLRSGKLDIGIPPAAKLSSIEPGLQLFDIPYAFRDRQHAHHVLDGALGQGILDKLANAGLVCPAIWESGFKHFTSNTPIRSPDDFDGLNVRTMKSHLIMSQFRAIGANPIAIDFASTRKALADGIVSAQENPLGSIYNMGFHEVQEYLTLSRHAYLSQVFCFSEKALAGLSAEDRQLLMQTAKETTGFQRLANEKQEQDYLSRIRNSGTKIITLSDQEMVLFRRAMQFLKHEAGDLLDDELMQLARSELDLGIEENTLLIGLDADLTLGSAPAGVAIRRGIQLAMDEINQQGGVLGKRLVLYERDHQGIAQRGIDNIRHFANSPEIVAVMGGLHSPVVLAELDEIERLQIPFLVPWAAATAIVDNDMQPNWVFRLSIRDADVGDYLVSQALNSSQKVGLLLENTGWGRGNEKSMRFALAGRGLEPVAVEWFNWGHSDFTPHLNRLKQAGTEVILLVANAPEAIQLVTDMAGFEDSFKVVSHWGITGGYFAQKTRKLAENLDLEFVQTHSFLNSGRDINSRLVRQYLKKFHATSARDIFSPVGTAHAYDLTHLLAMAITQAGGADRAAVREALENLPGYDGLIKYYARPFTPERHEALNESDLQMARFASDGTIVPAEQRP